MARIEKGIWDLDSDERGMIRDAVGGYVGANGPYENSRSRRQALDAAFAGLREVVEAFDSIEAAVENMEDAARMAMRAKPDDTETAYWQRQPRSWE